MTTYRNYIKSALFNYPSIFPSKYHVNAHLFACIGIGMAWSKKGTLEYSYKPERKSKTMRFDDLDERENNLAAEDRKDHPSLKSLNKMFLIEIEAERKMRQFTADNIDTILDNRCGHIPFHRSNVPPFLTYMKPEYYCTQYAAAFNFPDNIALDWAKGLEDFIGQWMYVLNCEYHPGNDKEDRMKHWPEKAKTLYNELQTARNKLMDKITGKDTATREREVKELTDRILAEIKAEEAKESK